MLWVLTIWLTHRGTMDDRLDRVQRVGLRALSALLCVVIAVPMATAVRYSLIQRDVIGTLFGQSGDVGTDGEAARPSVAAGGRKVQWKSIRESRRSSARRPKSGPA